ncbi:hypothetical protein C2G38_2114817 [Gigaspora rosea]|uniref:Secreted protein n=1 Tax=Gigaspora rosea TaxID=44941 RepID=A0A397UBL0_9GLOM|nr:hypothetical protein C2G38_2114817 [Gigaspora rosea]
MKLCSSLCVFFSAPPITTGSNISFVFCEAGHKVPKHSISLIFEANSSFVFVSSFFILVNSDLRDIISDSFFIISF